MDLRVDHLSLKMMAIVTVHVASSEASRQKFRNGNVKRTCCSSGADCTVKKRVRMQGKRVDWIFWQA